MGVSGFRRLILHIGRQKTGTTSLQAALAASRTALSAQGVLYPKAGVLAGEAGHHDLARALNPLVSDGAAVAGYVDAILAERQAEETLLISSEGLQNLGDMARLRGFIAALGGPAVDVLCYMREHLDVAVSGFCQAVQARSEALALAPYARRVPDVARFTARWREVGDLQLSWYAREVLEGGDIVRDVAARLGLSLAPVGMEQNPTIGGNLLVWKLACNQLGLTEATISEEVRRPFFHAMGDLALTHPAFTQRFFIDPGAAFQLRATSAYNTALEAMIGPVPLRHWAGAPALPDLMTLDADLARIAALADYGLPTGSEVRAAMAASGPWFTLTA